MRLIVFDDVMTAEFAVSDDDFRDILAATRHFVRSVIVPRESPDRCWWAREFVSQCLRESVSLGHRSVANFRGLRTTGISLISRRNCSASDWVAMRKVRSRSAAAR